MSTERGVTPLLNIQASVVPLLPNFAYLPKYIITVNKKHCKRFAKQPPNVYHIKIITTCNNIDVILALTYGG